jgi:hypothetical protein
MSYMAGVDPISAEICQGESITITAFGYDSYAWNTGATTESITVSPTATTTYTVTCTSNGVATTLTSTITVYPQAIITASVVPSADGQAHATLNAESFTVGCGSSDNITLVVTPDPNYRVYRVTLNGAEINPTNDWCIEVGEELSYLNVNLLGSNYMRGNAFKFANSKPALVFTTDDINPGSLLVGPYRESPTPYSLISPDEKNGAAVYY